MPINVHEFVQRWSHSSLREQQAAQSHFNELCQLIGHPTPTEQDPQGDTFTFEKQVTKDSGGQGRADVWYKGKFAWEYKGKHKDLDAAYHQLQAYKIDLNNPPLLVVCDFLEYRIYPQWPNTSGQPFTFSNTDLAKPGGLQYLEWLFRDPAEFLAERQRQLDERARITEDLARRFAELADKLRKYPGPDNKPLWEPMQIARFLTKLIFALFAEDIGLLPKIVDKPVFRYLVERAQVNPDAFARTLKELFRAMNGETDQFFMEFVPYFNGGLFADSRENAADGTEVLDLTLLVREEALFILDKVSEADWRAVNPTIFGTLFERALDESKRAQLGAHYTSESDIRLIVEPVLMQPLYREWDSIQAEAAPPLQTYLNNPTPRAAAQAQEQLTALHDRMMERLANTRVLDPACGSGNFLYVSLRALKDLEARVRQFFAPLGLPFRDVVTPRQLYGIEKDEFAAKLAQVVVWIGYLQWRYEDAGALHPVTRISADPRPDELTIPILKDKNAPGEADRIQCDDAILRYDAAGKPYEPAWPAVDVIVSNPPFLGGSHLRSELGDHYLEDMWKVYEGRIPGFSDLVCYWFEKARMALEEKKVKRVGLLATNSIRGGANRTVLERIKQTGDIFMAWGDRRWSLDGAAVRVSMVGFDDGTQQDRELDGLNVTNITPDLQTAVDITQAHQLQDNNGICFMGPSPKASFDIDETLARKMLSESANLNGCFNTDVVRPVASAVDLVQRTRQKWTIDFGLMSLDEASQYTSPFDYVKQHVFPVRSQNRRAAYAQRWWQYAEARPGMREALKGKPRFIATPAHAKHRIFVWMKPDVLCNQGTLVFARDDDYFFGALHAYPHEIWSLRMGTSLEDRPRYTPTTTFETYPFPWSPGQEPSADPAYQAISAAAQQLTVEREAWLNPPDLHGKALKDRTLTNLYNALEDYRAHLRSGELYKKTDELKPAAKFAPRLCELHAALDAAVLRAYGWADLIGRLRTSAGDEELLRRLLVLNLQRAG